MGSRLTSAQAHIVKLLWSDYVYLYLLIEIIFSYLIGLILQNGFLIYTLDGLLFFPIFAVHIYNWRIGRLFRIASFWGIARSFILISSILIFDNRIDHLIDQGLDYHLVTLEWILTGEGLPARPEEFIPLHIIGAFRVIISSLGSCGLITLIAGARELNIMNFHVAKLVQTSSAPLQTLLWGWPIWSLIRGWSYLSLMIGSVGMFFEVLRRSTVKWQQLMPYMLVGLLGAALDTILKVILAPQWRELLKNSL